MFAVFFYTYFNYSVHDAIVSVMFFYVSPKLTVKRQSRYNKKIESTSDDDMYMVDIDADDEGRLRNTEGP